MSGRCVRLVSDHNERDRWVDVPLLWTVEEDEILEDLVPPATWWFHSGQALTLVDDSLTHWLVTVIEDDHSDWLVKVRLVEPVWYSHFVQVRRAAGEAASFNGGLQVELDVPRQRLVTADQMDVCNAVDAVLDGVLERDTWRIRALDFDACGEWLTTVAEAKASIRPAFGDPLPYDSYAGEVMARCDDVMAQIERRLRTMPKQLSLLGQPLSAPAQGRRKRLVSSTGFRVASPRGCTAQQLSLFTAADSVH